MQRGVSSYLFENHIYKVNIGLLIPQVWKDQYLNVLYKQF